MTRKTAYYALAVVLLMGTMAGVASAGEYGMDTYGPADSSVSDQTLEGVEHSEAGEIREPVETGALPDASATEENYGNWLNMDVGVQNSIPELRGRPNIQAGD